MLRTFCTSCAISIIPSLLLAIGGSPQPVEAATTTGSFAVQMVITAACTVSSTTTLDFGSASLLSSDTDATSSVVVQCTNTTPYNIGLNAGTTAGATTTTRLMANGASTISYKLFSNSGRTTNWGNTVGTDTVAATGNGATQSFTVYGRVPTQTSTAPGTYTDTITVTVTY